MVNRMRGIGPACVALLVMLWLSGCDSTCEQSERRRKFDDVGEIDVYGRERQFSYGGNQAQDGSSQPLPQYAGRRHAHEVGEMRLDDEPVARKTAPPVRLEEVHPSVSAQPLNVPAPRSAPEYRIHSRVSS